MTNDVLDRCPWLQLLGKQYPPGRQSAIYYLWDLHPNKNPQWCEKPSENPKKKAQQIAAKAKRVGWGGVSASVGHPPLPSPGRGFLVEWGKDIVGSPFTTTVQPGPTSAAGEPNGWDRLHHENPRFFFWEKGWWVEIWNATNILGDEISCCFFCYCCCCFFGTQIFFWQNKTILTWNHPNLEGWHLLQMTQVFLCYESTSAVCVFHQENPSPKGGQLDHWHWLAICGSWGWGARVTPSRTDVV